MVRESIKSCDDSVQIAIEGLLKSYEEVCKNVAIAEKELEELCKKDPLIALFESIPGVGTIRALTYKA